ncbi:sensor histidine kinase [Iocasia frigidifontis]|uniref:histidine kinase n=1 Tax=Iocasia fonsfrigidae TaxID=2682810 RepID=A0A8A7KDM9_9FIRM|nr:HAMP domain-containing sensor histidine kinase [Iocasia fonsfrigidae]QTL97539.1 sensor histidine kinase [Iocasia fonsfrigidae]
MFKFELGLIIFLLILNITLVFLIEISLFGLIIIILLCFVTIILLYRIIKRKNLYQLILNHLKDISTGNLNRRIHIGDTDIYSELLLVLNQITERLQEEIIKSKEADGIRKRLLSNISHDIRTPLTSILGYLEALRDDLALDKEEREKYLNILLIKAVNLKEMIDEIFQMARLDADDFELDFQLFDLTEIIRECLIDFLPGIKQKGLDMKIDIPEEECIIYADRLSVERIIDNILKNSIEYGKDGGFIGIELSHTKKGFILSIWDKGPGIEKKEIPYVFERLYMGNKSRNKSLVGSGSGLGLAIAKKLLEEHGGKITLESIPWEKTVFQLYFPGN